MLTEAAMLEPKTQVSGAVLILDVEGLNLQHVLQFSPALAKILLDWVQVRRILIYCTSVDSIYTVNKKLLSPSKKINTLKM